MESLKSEKPNFRWLFLLMFSLAMAMIYRFAHLSIFLTRGRGMMPGIGLTLTQWLIVTVALIAAKTAGKLKLRGNASGIFLTVLALALGACYGIFASSGMRFYNLPILILLTVQGTYALTGQLEKPALSCAGLWEGFKRFWPALGQYSDVPFKEARSQRGRMGEKMRGVGIGLLLCIPVAVIVMVLLCSADSVFGDMISGALSGVWRVFDPVFIWKLVSAFLLGMILFSFLYALTQERKMLTAHEARAARPMAFLLPLCFLVLLYAAFAYIQVRYLFMGDEAVRIQGGYAEYARSGFFQLTLVAIISLCLILPALTMCRESKAVRIMSGTVALLVLVILFSAFWRMRGYILIYGLSLLRLLTLWAMVMILLALSLALLKCVRQDMRVCPILAATMLAGWVLLNYLNVDLLVARYNVRAYNAGRIERLDTDYLIELLSPDAAPALLEIENMPEEDKIAVLEKAALVWERSAPGAYDWSFGYLKTDVLSQ